MQQKKKIKTAYKKQALLLHPDKANFDEIDIAKKKFQKINTAQEILLNEKSKKIYDKYKTIYSLKKIIKLIR